mgnify:CR=1 FL=1
MTEPRRWTDEHLSAFIDGALEPHDADALMDELSRDDALAARLADLTEANAAISGAFDAPLHEPAPERLRALVEAYAPPPASSTPAAEVVDLAARRAAASAAVGEKRAGSAAAGPAPAWRMPIAAGLALAVGAVIGAQVAGFGGERRLVQLEAALIERGDPLHRALSSTPSAQSMQLAGGAQVRPVLSFMDGSGRLCREFEMASNASMALGVACRNDADWRLELLVPAADRPTGATGYVQASGYNEAAVDAVLTRLKAGEPLSADAEAKALAR